VTPFQRGWGISSLSGWQRSPPPSPRLPRNYGRHIFSAGQGRGTESVANLTAKKSPSLAKRGSRLMRFTVHIRCTYKVYWFLVNSYALMGYSHNVFRCTYWYPLKALDFFEKVLLPLFWNIMQSAWMTFLSFVYLILFVHLVQGLIDDIFWFTGF